HGRGEARTPARGVAAHPEPPVAGLARRRFVDRDAFDDPAARAVDRPLAGALPLVVAPLELRLFPHVLEAQVRPEERAPALGERDAARLAQLGQIEPLIVVARGIAVVPAQETGAP